mgnify:CR=1 FL=1
MDAALLEALTGEQRAVIAALPRNRTLSATADALEIDRSTVWRWSTPGQYAYTEAFRDALQQAKEQVGDEVEGEMLRRALAGESGMSDTLLIFATKRFRPEYREQSSVNITGQVVHAHVNIGELSPADAKALLLLAAAETDVVEGEYVALDSGDDS